MAVLSTSGVAAQRIPRPTPFQQQHQAAANRLIDAALADSAAWHRIAEMGDRFGPRFSGTPNLEQAIDWIMAEMRRDGLGLVRGEPVRVPRWVGGEESAELLLPGWA
jgi:carboxypeptidase Q